MDLRVLDRLAVRIEQRPADLVLLIERGVKECAIFVPLVRRQGEPAVEFRLDAL